MLKDRHFVIHQFFQPADGEPIRSVVAESADAVVVAWFVKPGQTITAHAHPTGQDTWTILSGSGLYRHSIGEALVPIAKGDVLVAHRGEIHGVLNDGDEPLMFVSVVSPALAGYEPLG